jgi:hypothetical protein
VTRFCLSFRAAGDDYNKLYRNLGDGLLIMGLSLLIDRLIKKARPSLAKLDAPLPALSVDDGPINPLMPLLESSFLLTFDKSTGTLRLVEW